MGKIKSNISSFKGISDPEVYVKWKKNLELLFDCKNFSEMKKVRLVAIQFYDYAITWWNQLGFNKRKNI